MLIKPQKHLFIMDPLEKLNLQLDSSLRMAYSLCTRGHQVYFATLADLSWRSPDPSPLAYASSMSFASDKPAVVSLETASLLPLAAFQGIHMRKDPPFDLAYITATWMLDTVRGQSRVFNDPQALRGFNEKLGILQFPQWIQPALVSSQPGELLDFAQNVCRGDAIIKPLHLYGGQGVFRLQLEKEIPETALAKLKEATLGGQALRLIQPFNPAIFAGEVRAFLLGGQALAWCLKKPAAGQFLANTRAQASLHPFHPSPALQAKVETLGQALLRQNIQLVGLDIIGEFISEINITSPRLLQYPGDERPYYDELALWFEQACVAN